MFRPETAELEEALLPLLEARNAYLIDFHFNRSKYGSVIEVFIDTDTGVTSELCSELSREFGKALDGLDFLQGRFQLVVSSPGFDRPLKFPRQYPKHKGHNLIVKHQENGSTVSTTGELTSTGDTGIVLKLENGKTKEVAFADILEAKVKPQW